MTKVSRLNLKPICLLLLLTSDALKNQTKHSKLCLVRFLMYQKLPKAMAPFYCTHTFPVKSKAKFNFVAWLDSD